METTVQRKQFLIQFCEALDVAFYELFGAIFYLLHAISVTRCLKNVANSFQKKLPKK